MSSPNAARDQQIAAKARLGQSHESLAAEYHLTRQRISQIIAAANPRSPEETQRQLIASRRAHAGTCSRRSCGIRPSSTAQSARS